MKERISEQNINNVYILKIKKYLLLLLAAIARVVCFVGINTCRARA